MPHSMASAFRPSAGNWSAIRGVRYSSSWPIPGRWRCSLASARMTSLRRASRCVTIADEIRTASVPVRTPVVAPAHGRGCGPRELPTWLCDELDEQGDVSRDARDQQKRECPFGGPSRARVRHSYRPRRKPAGCGPESLGLLRICFIPCQRQTIRFGFLRFSVGRRRPTSTICRVAQYPPQRHRPET